MIGGSLAGIGAIWGVAAFLVFLRFTDHAALRAAGRRIYARLLELRLYSDEPSVVWRAQKALIADNARFFLAIWRPVLIMAVPFALLYPWLDAVYGRTPLVVGQAAIVTAPLAGDDGQYELRAPPGIVVETGAVRDFRDHEIFWRIRALQPVRGELRLRSPGGDISRSIAAGARTLSPNRTEGLLRIDYPSADVAIAGFSLPWVAWFVLFSGVSAAITAFWRRMAAG